MAALHEQLRQSLPRLTADNYRETSPESWAYNCIAWAVGVVDSWWWPVAGRFWPPDVPRAETLDAFLAVFAALGYLPGATQEWDSSFEKVALYALGNTPTHAARQLPGGWWTSKLGPAVDIEHATPDAVAGGVYGEVVAILSRNRTA
jgi:hypothetical protein